MIIIVAELMLKLNSGMDYEVLLSRWSTNKQTDKCKLSKVEQADLHLQELALLESMKNISVSTEDSG